jgi:hypothetical protein
VSMPSLQTSPKVPARAIFVGAIPYITMLVLLSIPFYDWLYYWGTALLWVFLLLASLILIPLRVATLIPKRGCAVKIALSAILLVAVLAIGPLSYGFKSSTTHLILESLYCDLTKPVPSIVLGGLREVGPEPPRTGAFEDTSICLPWALLPRGVHIVPRVQIPR